MTNRKTAVEDGSINNSTAQTSVQSGQKSWHEVFTDSHNEGDNVRLIISELSENFPTNLKDINFVMAAEAALVDQHHYHMSVDYDAEEMAKIRLLHKSFRELEFAMLDNMCRKEVGHE